MSFMNFQIQQYQVAQVIFLTSKQKNPELKQSGFSNLADWLDWTYALDSVPYFKSQHNCFSFLAGSDKYLSK